MSRRNQERRDLDLQALAEMSRSRFAVTICALLTTTFFAVLTAFLLTAGENQQLVLLIEKIVKSQLNASKRNSE
jgi:hypothetical protein